MIYTDKTRKAMVIAFKAHRKQVDKSGVPYIYHPMHLAEQMSTENTVCIALLHDVMEDTDISEETLVKEGFGGEIMESLKLLVHDKKVPYVKYIEKLKNSGNRDAITVKLADLKHNGDISRLAVKDEKSLNRLKNYSKAVKLLEG